MDNKTARIKRLREMIPYLRLENNREELERVNDELYELCGERISFDETDRLGDALSESACVTVAREEIRNGNFEKAKLTIEKGLKKHPFSKELLYLLASVKNRGFYSFRYSSEEEYTKDELLNFTLAQAANDVFISDYDIKYRIYCAIGDYKKARRDCEINAKVAADFGRYDDSIEWYRRGLNFDMAEKMEEEKLICEEFKAEVGDGVAAYVKQRLDDECSDEIDEHNRLHKISVAHPKGKSWLSVILLVLGFLISILFDFNPDADKTPIVIVFTLVFSLGFSLLSDNGFKIKRTIGIAVLTFFLTALFYKNMFWELSPFLSKLPEGLLINIITFAMSVIFLIPKINAIPGDTARRKMKKLSQYMDDRSAEYRKDLRDRYAQKVGEERVKSWMKWLLM